MKSLKELRIKHNMTQAELASFLSVACNTVSQWETGINEPDISTLKKLAKFFNVTTDFLLDLDRRDGVNYPNNFIEATEKEKRIIVKYRTARENVKSAVETILGVD